MIPSSSEWYDDNPDLTQYYQGDVLRDIPFPSWPTFETATKESKWGVLRPLRSGDRSTPPSMQVLPNQLIARAMNDVADAFSDPTLGEYVVARCHKRSVIVLTRACQLDNPQRKHFVVAPVTSFDDLPEAQKSPQRLNDLRLGKIPHLFYLPASSGVAESFADFLKMTSIHRTFAPDDGVQTRLLARLSSMGTVRLQQALSLHFGQQFGFDHTNVCPQTGLYRCGSCFALGRPVADYTFQEGKPFGCALIAPIAQPS